MAHDGARPPCKCKGPAIRCTSCYCCHHQPIQPPARPHTYPIAQHHHQTYNKLVTLVAPIIQRSLTCSNLQPPWPSELPDSQPPCSSQVPHLPPPLHLLHGKAAPPHTHTAALPHQLPGLVPIPTGLHSCAVATPATQGPVVRSVGEGAALEFTCM